jgi:hypothetical protein
MWLLTLSFGEMKANLMSNDGGDKGRDSGVGEQATTEVSETTLGTNIVAHLGSNTG